MHQNRLLGLVACCLKEIDLTEEGGEGKINYELKAEQEATLDTGARQNVVRVQIEVI